MSKPKPEAAHVVVENNPAPVSNSSPVEHAVTGAVQTCVTDIFHTVVKMEKVQHIATDIAALLTQELRNASFMTEQLDLNEAQVKKLLDVVEKITMTARDKYLGALKKDTRTKDLVGVVEANVKRVVDIALSGIGQAINRGAVINATAVKANATKEDVNSCELVYASGTDLTIPTKCVLISSNCVAAVQDACKVILARERVDPATGEIISEPVA